MLAIISLKAHLIIYLSLYLNGIRVNSVNPAATRTPMYDDALEFLKNKREQAAKAGIEVKPDLISGKISGPQSRIAEATEISDMILFLVSEESSNVTGSIMPVDGGFTSF